MTTDRPLDTFHAHLKSEHLLIAPIEDTRQNLIVCYIKSCHLIGQYQWHRDHSVFKSA